LAFLGGAACSGATMPALSGVSAGAASTTCGGSAAAGSAVASPADAVAAADAAPGPAAPEPVGVAWAAPAATGDVFAETFADVSAVMPAAGAAAFVGATGAAALCRVERTARTEISGLSPGAAAATEAGRGAGFADTAGLVAVTGAAVAGETDGTAAARTLVTIARAAIGVFSGSLGRPMSERTTPAPAVAPIAVATSTMRAVRAKLGAGAK
jgi:hypothetical protein